MSTVLLLGVIGASFAASAVGVGLFRRAAVLAQIVDVPNARSSHSRPTPRGAGVVFVLVIGGVWLWTRQFEVALATGAALSAIVIAGLSGVDDLRPLGSGVRLLVHFGCATVAVLSIARAPAAFPWIPALLILSIVWVVGLTNVYNFMDGIDGISATQAVVTGAAVAIAARHVGSAAAMTIGAAIVGVSAGFLVHNWPPARVFMGDVGSAFLGFTFAVLMLDIARSSVGAAILIVLSLWPFLFDASVTLIRRALAGENILTAHRSHLYQRLVIAGWSHARVSVLYGLAAASGAAVAFWGMMRPADAPMVFALVPLMAAGLWLIVQRQEARAKSR